MTRTIHLHLGMHKTGSTALQLACAGYDDGRTAYVALGDTPNHSHALATLFAEDPGRLQFNRAAAADPAAFRRLSDRLEHQFAAQLAMRHDLVLSGEGLTTLLRAGEVETLVRRLESCAGRVVACAYVRGPQSFIRSQMQQVLKSGRAIYEPARFWPGYRRRFAKWEAALADGGLRLVPYQGRSDGDLAQFADFAQWSGIDADWLAGRARTANPSLSADALALVVAAWRFQPVPGVPGGASPRDLVSALAGFGGGIACPGPAAMSQLLRRCADDIAWISARLGAPPPDADTPEDGVVFDDAATVCRHARAVLPAALGWLEATPGKQGPVKLVQALARRL
jgi:hypothetical protein